MKAKFFKFTQCPFVNHYFYPLLLLLITCCITATKYLSLLECFLIENTALLIAINPMSTAAYDISIACVARILTSKLHRYSSAYRLATPKEFNFTSYICQLNKYFCITHLIKYSTKRIASKDEVMTSV